MAGKRKVLLRAGEMVSYLVRWLVVLLGAWMAGLMVLILAHS